MKDKERKRFCVNCGNNIRKGDIANIECYCQIDGHYIGYLDNFVHWCRRWKKGVKGNEE